MTKAAGLLWQVWAGMRAARPRRIVLIEADRDRAWTAGDLESHALAFGDRLPSLPAGARVAFRLPNGADWLGLFLALQRARLAAIPLDAGLPAEGCRDLAQRLGARALYLDGAFSLLEKNPREVRCCCVKVTSGSDGLAKGIACRAEHLIADGKQVAATMGLRPSDRNFAAIPFGHSYGLGNLILPLILQGTGIVVAKEYVPRQLIGWLEKYRVTVLPLVPALARILAEMPGTAPLDGVRKIISAGAVLSPGVAQVFYRRYGRKIHNFYGSSETGGICYDRSGAASLSGRSVGRPLAGVEVKVRRGRITVRSAAVATPGRRWILPDIGEWSSRGELVLLGRRGGIANIGGRKVHPREIEQVVREIEGVSDVFVWLRRDEGRDVLCGAVETLLSLQALEQRLAGLLPTWKMPKRIFAERELPRTERGKLDTAKLRQRFA